MASRCKGMNASTRRLFRQLRQNPDIPLSALRYLAHISPRLSETEWRQAFPGLVAAFNASGRPW